MLQPPTDNLYKFLAIFGLVLIGFGVFAPLQRYQALMEANVKSESAYAALLREFTSIEYAASARGLECSFYKTSPELFKDREKPNCRELPALHARVKEIEADARRARSQAEALAMRRDFLLQQYTMFVWVGATLIGAGVLLSAFGFVLWYHRLQRFQDAVRREIGADPPAPSQVAKRPKRR